MLLKNYKTIFLNELASLYDEKEIESFFYLVLEKFHYQKRIDLALNPEMILDEKQASLWNSVVVELKKQKPIQYILGVTEFYGLPFIVNENVLIPRPETEELVDLIITNESRENREEGKVSILDIGTGSGCIAITLAKNLSNAEVFAIDVSEEALEVAKKNAVLNNVDVTFHLKDILKVDNLEQQFDTIVSNPPYVRNLEKAAINSNVLDYEPHLALFVADNEALLFYRKITQLAKLHLKPKGKLYFEINQYLGKETIALVESYGFKNVILHKDIYGNDRMIAATL
ncbi:MAG: peptide chain release factor N(5)-glutamine methyltransferase [Flavobacterium sp.]|uniref:peptide chain release factor N(5)-glutamine methyltransferase n=1 Tax=Flavobacterium sp. TaxID=239 RepID=UPI003BE05DC7